MTPDERDRRLLFVAIDMAQEAGVTLPAQPWQHAILRHRPDGSIEVDLRDRAGRVLWSCRFK